MTRRNWIILGIAAVIVVLVAATFLTNRQASQQAASPEITKSAFIDYCLKQANSAAMQQGSSFNEEQKRVLQQVCGCGADQMSKKFKPADLAAFQDNPNDPALLGPIKEIMQSCAAAANMPATNP